MSKLDQAANKILHAVKERLGDGYEVNLHNVLKNNSKSLTGITIKREGENISPTFYIDQEIYNYALEMQPLEAITDKIINQYFCDNQIREGYDISSILDFNWIKDRLICHFINTSLNTELLGKIPSVPFLDLSIVFRVTLDLLPMAATPSFLIRNEHLKLWGTDTETIYRIAKGNTPKMLPAEIIELSKMAEQILAEHDVSDEEMKKLEMPETNMYVLSNKKQYFGSYCINYPGLLSSLAEKLNANLYILPASVNETIIIADLNDRDPEELKCMVAIANANSIAEETILSYQIYYFSRETKEITKL